MKWVKRFLRWKFTLTVETGGDDPPYFPGLWETIKNKNYNFLEYDSEIKFELPNGLTITIL